MLHKLSEQVADCLRYAREAGERAGSASDAKVRTEYLELERRWLALAENYEFSRQLADFSTEVRRRLVALRPSMPPDHALPLVCCPLCGRKMHLARIELSIDGGQKTTFDCACGANLLQTTGRNV